MSLLQRILHAANDAAYSRGMAAFNAGRHAEARSEFEACLDRIPPPSEPVRSLARFYLAEAAVALGEAALRADDPAAARREFERALACDLDFPRLHFAIAVTEAALGNATACTAALDTALKLDPRLAEARCLRVLVLYDTGAREAGLQEAAALLDAGPLVLRGALPRFLRAELLAHASAHPQLAALWQACAEADPEAGAADAAHKALSSASPVP